MLGRTGTGNCWYAPVTFGGICCSALVDTGSSATLVRPDAVGSGTTVLPTTVRLQTVTGDRAPMVGEALETVEVGRERLHCPIWVAELEDCILGLDVLEKLDCVISTKRGTLTFPDGHVVQMTRQPTQPKRSPAPTVAVLATEAAANTTSVCIPDRHPILPHTPPTTAAPTGSGGGEDGERVLVVREVWQGNCDGLSHVEQGLLWQLLLEFKDSFSLSEDDVGQTHLAQHSIDTRDAPPIRMRPRRLPMARQAAAEKALRNMQRAGLIEPSTSPWAAPIVMVPKKTKDDWRFCVDFRRLNGVTKRDAYPFPRVDESLDAVAGSSWFTSLDLRSGYWQVPLTPDARPKTAFVTHGGLWQFKVLPFGLCNAPATFERLMDNVLAGIPRQECVVYLDDILAHGDSFETALGALRRVLERVTAAGLKLNPQKCRFMRREVRFLGHKLGSGGIGTAHEKVQAVEDWPTPSSGSEVKSFTGLASYYRRFVRDFSTIAAPLFRLQRPREKFIWTDECQRAFTSLKKALLEAPVLTPPDPTLPFILDTDASNVGVGAVLSQVTSEGEKVVAYYSGSLNKHERRYCVTRRELLAVVMAVEHFKYYLGGLHFTVRSDHSALQWLMTFREPEGQLARWIEELQAYDFNVIHRAGRQHGNADALSRRPCAADGCRYCERREVREEEQLRQGVRCATAALTAIDTGEWRRKQEEDADIRPVLTWVAAQHQPRLEEIGLCSRATKGLWSMFPNLRLCDGVLQRGWKDAATGETLWQVVVPRALRETVLQSVHGAPGSGHFGVSKTLRRLRQGFYWGQHGRDVGDYCRRCDSCTARKGPTGTSHCQLQQFPTGCPMERVGIDVLGPFPRSEKGNRYILTAMDYFTKWPEAYCLPDQEAETIVDALVEGMFSRLGVPEVIHTDQGRNFESRVFAAMCEKLGSHKTRTTPLHPQSDGLVERFNRTLGQQLAIVTAKHQRDWDAHVPLVLMAYRSATQDSTSCSPALLMLGREIRTPAEMMLGRPPDLPADPPGLEYARKLQDRLECAHEFARNQLRSAGARQKRNYDVHTKGQHFTAGELVWVYNPQRKKGRCPKLDSKWMGPCRVLERLGEVVYRVQLPARGRRVALHRDRLAPYRGTGTPPGEGGERRDVALDQSLQLINCENWEKKIEGLTSIRRLAHCHPELLTANLHRVCLAVAQERGEQAMKDSLAQLEKALKEVMEREVAREVARRLAPFEERLQKMEAFIRIQADGSPGPARLQNLLHPPIASRCSPQTTVRTAFPSLSTLNPPQPWLRLPGFSFTLGSSGERPDLSLEDLQGEEASPNTPTRPTRPNTPGPNTPTGTNASRSSTPPETPPMRVPKPPSSTPSRVIPARARALLQRLSRSAATPPPPQSAPSVIAESQGPLLIPAPPTEPKKKKSRFSLFSAKAAPTPCSTNSNVALDQSLQLIKGENWEKKIEGLTSIRRLAHCHPELLTANLHRVCLAVTQEVQNLRSMISRAAMTTLGDMYLCLQRAMDPELDWTARVLLQKAGETSQFIQQDVHVALGHMVHNCSPKRCIKVLLNGGLSDRNAGIRACNARLLEALVEVMGATRLLGLKREMLDSFLSAASRLPHDASPEVRSSGRKIIGVVSADKRLNRKLIKLLEKKIEGLTSIRRLAHCHPELLTANLHRVCLAVTQEVQNLRSMVSRAAMTTLGDMYLCLQRAMNPELDWTARVLLQKAGETSQFIQQDVHVALGHRVHNCSPKRCIKVLLNGGLSDRNAGIRACNARLLEALVEVMGATRLLGLKKEMLDSFLSAASRLPHDASPEVRSSGRKIIGVVSADKRLNRKLIKLLEKKIEGLTSIRQLAHCHPELLTANLHRVCLAVTQEVQNLRSMVSRAAMTTLGDMYLCLQRAMDPELDWTARVLLQKAGETSHFIQQDVHVALGHMVHNCSPNRCIKVLLNGGLRQNLSRG
ncbi:uncharacterized protein LOC133125281 [Conger conger]|uniref:uncharacterized protein LOC133125281 n=1 Tax=Conger conger TaxID=82655 RepID=UPI002A5A2132|nr:uncharacterized protein LOC133125281 [Conger conger]